jgi:dihydroorotate dehydrogenase electron transfer subunit
MKLLDFTVKENHRFQPTLSLLVLHSDEQLPEMPGGGFVNVLVPGEAGVMLRRPISICNFIPETGDLHLLVKDLGRGSHALCNIEVGKKLNLLAPLGKGFSMPAEKSAEILLIGGGVGIAPLLYWGKLLKEAGYAPTYLLGGKTTADIPMLEEFRRYGNVEISTEDGSMGEKGFVTQHSIFLNKNWDKFYVCGPDPMMKAVVKASRHIPCEVSLEQKMACGLGACLCCVTDTKEGHKCTCTEGPVFDAEYLNWNID